MNDVLSNEQVAALVEAARQGNVQPAEEAPAHRRRAKRVRDIEGLQAMVAAGATRIGASAGVRIVQESRGQQPSGRTAGY